MKLDNTEIQNQIVKVEYLENFEKIWEKITEMTKNLRKKLSGLIPGNPLASLCWKFLSYRN